MSSKACQRLLWAWRGSEGAHSPGETSLRLTFLTTRAGHQPRLHLANHSVSPAELSLKPQHILFQHVFGITFGDLRGLRLQDLSGKLELAVGVVDEKCCHVLGVYEFDEDLPHEAPAVLEVGEHLLRLCEGLDSPGGYMVDPPGGLFPRSLLGFYQSF